MVLLLLWNFLSLLRCFVFLPRLLGFPLNVFTSFSFVSFCIFLGHVFVVGDSLQRKRLPAGPDFFAHATKDVRFAMRFVATSNLLVSGLDFGQPFASFVAEKEIVRTQRTHRNIGSWFGAVPMLRRCRLLGLGDKWLGVAIAVAGF